MSVERHSCETMQRGHGYLSYEYGAMEADPEGDYVKFSDYEVVEAERDALQAKLNKGAELLDRFVSSLSPADQRRIKAAARAAEENSDDD